MMTIKAYTYKKEIGNKGIFELSFNIDSDKIRAKDIVNLILLTGIGSKRSQGYGMVEILDNYYVKP